MTNRHEIKDMTSKGKTYDAIVIGAGSVGLPTAYFLTLD